MCLTQPKVEKSVVWCIIFPMCCIFYFIIFIMSLSPSSSTLSFSLSPLSHSPTLSISSEIVSADLLEELMASEGEWWYNHVFSIIRILVIYIHILLYTVYMVMFLSMSYLFFLALCLPVFSPLLRLSPPPGDCDYIYNLDESEGLCDLFDIPILNLWPLNPSGWKMFFKNQFITFFFCYR